jgi:hypothetical protein
VIEREEIREIMDTLHEGREPEAALLNQAPGHPAEALVSRPPEPPPQD